MLTIEIFGHMDAGDRTKWTAPQDTRPLSDLGDAQARYLCGALARRPIDALYSSAALRCRQSIEPLASLFNLPVTVLPGLHETDGWQMPDAWTGAFASAEALGGAFAAGAALRSLGTIRAQHASGRVAACTHGDVLPALVLCLAGAYDLELHAPNRTRGGWYTLIVEDERVEVQHRDVLPAFPLSVS